MSVLSRGLKTNEDWQDLVAWDEELYDPLFQGDITFTGASSSRGINDSFGSSFHAGSYTSEQPYAPSAPPSIADGPSFDYTVSAPPSVAEGPSSLGQTYSWMSTSPSFSTAATSPLIGRDEQVDDGSFNGCENFFSSIGPATESPVLDTRGVPPSASSSGSFQPAPPNVFNPYIVGSPHAFSRLDVSASQAFSNFGAWADQPQIIEPIPELDHVGAIPIPHLSPQSFSNALSSNPWSEILSEQQQTGAIGIPQAHRRAAASNPNPAAWHWSHRVPPPLSVSPELARPRSAALSRSTSRSEPRRNRNSQTTPSPTSNTFGWVSYQPNTHTNRLVPLGTEGGRGRRQRGRTKALTAEQRRNAALMRVIGACSNCKRRKEKCDAGTPCKSCLDHYKGDLIHFPCRDRLLSDLSKTFLSHRLGWHPTDRSITSFVGPVPFDISTGITYTIPLNFGFGPALHIGVNPVHVSNTPVLEHNHVIYSWPPSTSVKGLHRYAVLPAVLSAEDLSKLPETLDTHLSLLVTQHFHSFPLYCSPLRILREIYIFYRSLPTHTSHSRLLHQALKLLVLVHIGGDLTLPSPTSDPVLAQLLRTSTAIPTDITPTPCLIRAQFGAKMPTLALHLMKSLLSSLENLFLNRSCTEWPLAIAVLIVILMTIESIQYHAAKLPYHHHNSYPTSSSSPDVPSSVSNAANLHDFDEELRIDDEAVNALFAFYATCFPGCHARLRPDWEGDIPAASSPSKVTGFGCVDTVGAAGGPGDKFIQGVREAVMRAGEGDIGYLARRAEAQRQEGDMGFFFDRLVARLLVLKT